LSQYKTCCRCRKVLSLDSFGSHKRYKDFKQPSCLICAAEYRQSWKQKKLEVDPDYFNRESRERRAKNPEKVRAYKNEWRSNNLDTSRESARKSAQKSRLENPEKHLEYQRNYRIKNKEKSVINKQIRRIRVYKGGSFLIFDIELKRLYGMPCVYCGSKDNIEIDHVLPLSRGGRNSIGNMQPLCMTCNRSKGNKTMMEWRLRKMKQNG